MGNQVHRCDNSNPCCVQRQTGTGYFQFQKVNMKERVIAFAGGDLLAMFGMWHLLDLRAMFVDVAFKVILTALLGIVGGITGLLGKDIYKALKSYRNAKK
jgi:hypothetical protein